MPPLSEVIIVVLDTFAPLFFSRSRRTPRCCYTSNGCKKAFLEEEIK